MEAVRETLCMRMWLRHWNSPVIRQGTFNLKTFGSSTPITVQRNVVRLSLGNIWDKHQSVEIDAVVTPKAVMEVPGDQLQMELMRRGR